MDLELLKKMQRERYLCPLFREALDLAIFSLESGEDWAEIARTWRKGRTIEDVNVVACMFQQALNGNL